MLSDAVPLCPTAVGCPRTDRYATQEAAVNTSTTRLTATVAALAACGLALTGCSAGQIAQTATQVAAVNGTARNVGSVALRNVHLQAVQSSDFLQPGTVVPLAFVVSNESIDVDDKLVNITSEVGQVALTGDLDLPAMGALWFNAAPEDASTMGQTTAGQTTAGQMKPAGETTPPTAQVTLSEPVSNGLSYDFTFTFEKAGSTTVAVPVAGGDV